MSRQLKKQKEKAKAYWCLKICWQKAR
jgi:hypothetical protein